MTEPPINQVVCGDCREVMRGWPAESINFVCFSPPYWGLRNYGENVNTVWGGDPSCEHAWVEQEVGLVHENRNNLRGTQEEVRGKTRTAWIRKYDKLTSGFCPKCGAWYGQLGLEPDFRMYIEHMVEVGREIKRILRKDGSWYLNLGDTYFGDSPVRNKSNEKWERVFTGGEGRRSAASQGPKPKCKLLMPYRVALALVDDGWVCRSDITWHKPNAMPSSVKDRLTCQTERVFHLIKSRRYFYDLDAIREPHSTATIKRATQPTVFEQTSGSKQDMLNPITGAGGNYNRPAEMVKSVARKLTLGKNPGDVILTKHDKAVGRTKRSYTDSLHTKEYHPLGANPSDVIQSDPWLEILEERAHFGGAQREAYEIYLTWKRENPKGTYEQFYDLVKSKKLSKYQKMKWQTGISDKWTSWGNYASYLHLPNPQGKPPSDFWEITTVPSNDYWCPNCKDFVKQKEMKCVRCGMKVTAHFAVYPEALCERPIKSSCPAQVCKKCGRPRERIVERPNMDERPIRKTDKADGQHPHVNWDGYPRSAGQAWLEWRRKNPDRTIGWTDCGCGASFESGIVLDPMCGSGTTLVVAKRMGLRYIGIDLNPDYCEMARKRLARVERPIDVILGGEHGG